VAPEQKQAERNFSAEAGEILAELAERDPRVCAVTAAMADGTGLTAFRDAVPDRFFDVGIAEEHALTFSAGLAADGYKPYFAVYSSFLQRGYDNVIHDIALQNLPVTLLVDRAGISGGDGPTHHGIFDVAFLSQIPNLEILSPSTFTSLREAMTASLAAEHPVAIRYANCGDREWIDRRFTYGQGRVRADFSPEMPPTQIIITYGKIVSEAVAVCNLLNGRMPASCGVILLDQLKPYDGIARQIEALLPHTVKTVVFLEEGIRNGGAGMILRDKLTLPAGCAYRHLGIDDVFDTDKTTGNLYADFGIGREDLLVAMTE